jgi:hypothetical protein
MIMRNLKRQHTTTVTQFLKEDNVDILLCPARSSDLQHVWDLLERPLRNLCHLSRNLTTFDCGYSKQNELPQNTVVYLFY